MKFFVPVAVFMTDDGGQCCIRDYAGQSGRFCVIGPYTTDIMGSHKTPEGAKAHIERRFGPGEWTEGLFTGQVSP